MSPLNAESRYVIWKSQNWGPTMKELKKKKKTDEF